MTIWFDVEDLIVYFQHVSRPTGIQRLTFEIYRELAKIAGPEALRFCRHGATPADYIVVDWAALEQGILAASAADTARPEPPAAPPVRYGKGGGGVADAPPRRLHRFLHSRITPALRLPLGEIYRAQRQSLRAGLALLRALAMLAAKPFAPPAKIGEVTIRMTTEQARFGPRDIFVVLGAPWGLLNPAAGRALQIRHGLRFAVLIHDLIPELYPEWTSTEGLAAYRLWLREVVPHADAIFAYSRNTTKDLLERMALWGLDVPAPAILPVGHRLPQRCPETMAQPPPGIPPGQAFVLFVSTIEVRKNHALLFRVWRRLLRSLPEAQVPYLVFAGKLAWMTGDLLTQIANAGWLDGHIRLVESPAEPQLAALYAQCAFTVFPSLYEGWGLPVTESLSFGKTVAASNRAAIPEAGGEFCCYFDPENLDDAYTVIRGMIENPERVAALEAKITEDFRPPAWADTAGVLLGHLRALEDAPASGGKGGTVRVAA